MLKAIILIHLWTIVVACCAWVLQSDGSGKLGASFPAAKTWLKLILIGIIPGLLCVIPLDAAIDVPKIGALDVFSSQSSSGALAGPAPINFLAIYLGFAMLLMGRTLWQWSRLQRLPLTPGDKSDVFTTTSNVPPLTLSWPRRAVVVPIGLETHGALIAHERAHLRHYDAELTLLLLLLRDLLLFSPGIGYLVRQWRLAIELRADHAAIQDLGASERKDYASLLLTVLRSDGAHRGKGALPCPTAHLNSKGHRSAKMRLMGIMESEPNPHRLRWSVALLLATFGASIIGFFNSSATAKVRVLDVDLTPIEYAERTSLELPASCLDLKKDDLRLEKTTPTINGKVVPQYEVRLGSVVLVHDVRRDGSVHNPRINFSTHPCFEANAKEAIVGWVAEPQEFETKNVAVKMHFVISADTVRELKLKLDSFL